jgi:uncharacterized membrane protein
MAILLTFVTILAWLGFVGGLFVTGMRIWGAISTTELQRLAARMNGKIITHPIKVSGTVMIISGAFLLAKALS